jgi:esterase/lipase superfamily enzyme
VGSYDNVAHHGRLDCCEAIQNAGKILFECSSIKKEELLQTYNKCNNRVVIQSGNKRYVWSFNNEESRLAFMFRMKLD